METTRERGAPTADAAAIGAFWDAMVEPGSIHEVRCPNARKAGPLRLFGTASGYFDAREAFVREVSRISGDDAPAAFLTLNPVDAALLARADNHLKEKADSTTGDTDVLFLRHLLVDVDSQRPAGISATDAEVAAALASRDAVHEYLRLAGWPEPRVLSMSGNGGGILYRLDDLDNTPDNALLLERCLKALAGLFDTEAVHIDATVFNPARITKIVGSVAAKGDHCPHLGRPWRLATAEYPAGGGVVSRELLAALAATVADASPTQPPHAAQASADGGRTWTVPEVLDRVGISYRAKPWRGGTAYDLDRCLTSTDHARGAAVLEMPSGALSYMCQHARCQGKGWRDVREQLGLGPVGERPANGTVGASAWREPPAGADATHAEASPNGQGKTEDAWPEPPGEAAFAGLAGEVVRLADPHTEADPVAVLVTFLSYFGAAVGAGPHALVGATVHRVRDFFVLVGRSSKARKGDSEAPVRRLFEIADQEWCASRIRSGLSSGEGLIHEVRDPVEVMERIKERGKPVRYESVVRDEGVRDKRLLVVEPEFARVLLTQQRQGNTLSPLLRQAWDRGDLASMTKSPLRATGAHVVLLGHVTLEELRRELTDISASNGYANRFCWLAVQRSKLLPSPPPFAGDAVEAVGRRIRERVAWAKGVGEMARDADATALWAAVYPDLSSDRPGMAGALLQRSEAHALRLSALYALLDGSRLIRPEHLLSALEFWGYCERSVVHLFGTATGDPIADTIHAALVQNRELTRWQITELLGRHVPSARIAQALLTLLAAGKARFSQRDTGGRPSEVWRPA